MNNSDLQVPSVYRVFLNYPFDEQFEALAHAMHFAVVAAGLVPVCAMDESAPDRLRLEMLFNMVSTCRFSIHDFSRYKGEGEENFARFNMPLEMGMALFYTFFTQKRGHRCAFFVETSHDYQRFASDLAGLDPKHHNNDDPSLVTGIYEWLREVGQPYAYARPTVEVQEKYQDFKKELEKVKGSGKNGRPTHHEAREVMYTLCARCGWWTWRNDDKFKFLFPEWQIAWKSS